jgi:hypothetical protein
MVMSIAALTLSMYHSKATYSTRLVLMAIANFEGENGAYPSHDTIGRLAGGLNRRTVQRAIDDLIDLGELSEVRREGITNLYRVAIVCPDECDRSSNHRNKTGGGAQTAGGLGTAGGSGAQTAGGAVHRPPEPLVTVINNQTLRSNQFEEFWNLYPRKEGKKPAFKAFTSALARTKFEDILAGIEAYKRSDRVKRGFIKLPSTWLNEDAWEDAATQVQTEQVGTHRRERDIEITNSYLAELKAQEQLAAPPPKCEHGLTVARCKQCLTSLS